MYWTLSSTRKRCHCLVFFFPPSKALVVDRSSIHSVTDEGLSPFPCIEPYQVMGSIVGGRADMVEMLEFAAVKGIKPKCETMPLSQVRFGVRRPLLVPMRGRWQGYRARPMHR